MYVARSYACLCLAQSDDSGQPNDGRRARDREEEVGGEAPGMGGKQMLCHHTALQT